MSGSRTSFVGIQDLGRFGHEKNTRKNDHVRSGNSSLLRELQAIAHKIREVLNLRFLVIVRQYHGIHLPLQARYLLFEIEVRQGGQIFGLCRCDHFCLMLLFQLTFIIAAVPDGHK